MEAIDPDTERTEPLSLLIAPVATSGGGRDFIISISREVSFPGFRIRRRLQQAAQHLVALFLVFVFGGF
jgi:hypothetical protein